MEYSISSNASKHLIVRTNHPSHHHGVHHESLLRASVRTQLESADDDDDDDDQTTCRHCADDDAHATRDFDDRDVHRAQ